jgi:polyribonucleotide nucleotidyltransferase
MTYQLKLENKNLEINLKTPAVQAAGSVLAQYGETVVLATVCFGPEKEGLDFFPLTVDYEERYYAAGKILGPRFTKREGRPSQEAILIARAIDRAIRPLFPKDFKREVQVVITCLSWDGESEPGSLGLIAASLALFLSPLPWQGPIGVVRIGQNKNGRHFGDLSVKHDNFILFPNYREREEGDLDLLISAVESNGELLINMIEAQGNEVSEETILKAIDFAKPYLKEIIDFQKKILKENPVQKIELKEKVFQENLLSFVKEFLEGKLKEALFSGRLIGDPPTRCGDKIEGSSLGRPADEARQDNLKKLEEDLKEKVKENFGENLISQAMEIYEIEKEKIFIETVLNEKIRPDGRKIDEIRPLDVQVGVLPRTHGSALFSRGLTKVLSITTLGSPGDQQLLEGMEIKGKKRFLHHYNFPPFAPGEIGKIGSPGRREIGHGALAEKALFPLIPSFDDFPYTIRVVSEVLSSNGSTSMASVCGASLSLMDAGVPISKPAAGISIGLVAKEDLKEYLLLTDIQGPEDHLGFMDFKVAGTETGITAIQMDVKIPGITKEILETALTRAKEARLKILEKMKSVLPAPRPEISPFAPKIYSIKIDPSKIGNVIGPGGRIINEIIENCGVTIDIEETGKIFVTGETAEAAQKAIDWITNLTREIKVGEIFQGKVKRILDFGAIIEILPGQDGLCHISQFADFRIPKLESIIKVGDIIPVKVISIDEAGRINLSAKEAGFKIKRDNQDSSKFNPLGRFKKQKK